MSSQEMKASAENIRTDLERRINESYARAAAHREEARKLETDAQKMETEHTDLGSRYGLARKYGASSEAGELAAGSISHQEMRAIGNRREIFRVMSERDSEGSIGALQACRQMQAAGVFTTDAANAAKALSRTLRRDPEFEETSRARFRYIGPRRDSTSNPPPLAPADGENQEQSAPETRDSSANFDDRPRWAQDTPGK